MYLDAIEKVARFTRPIHSISRTYGSDTVQAGAATMFLINSDGWALTCGHVVDQLANAKQINKRYSDYRKEVKDSSEKLKLKLNEARRRLAQKYGYKEGVTVELQNRFMDCVEGFRGFTIIRHSKIDIALIHFEGYSKLLCNDFPIFASDSTSLKPGKMLCRLGYPFPEFNNFEYNRDLDQISWTELGKSGTPRFPIEGMITRGILDEQGKRTRFEMSTPGLRGQSGGPVFDAGGVIWGMQSETGHLDLDFDVDRQVLRRGKPEHARDYAFLHVGICIHVESIKDFMRENSVAFNETQSATHQVQASQAQGTTA